MSRRHDFADLPDHGELLVYATTADGVRRDGAYTWHRARLSEQHALHAIAGGHLRVVTPDGQALDFIYDRHIEHPSGDWTWIGHLPGQEGVQTILTFGTEAAFGSIARPRMLPLRLTVRDGVSWLVETDPVKVAAIVNAATRPRKPDYHVVPRAELPTRGRVHAAAAPAAAASVATGAATATAANTIDLLVGYTAGFANANGGASGALTRLNFLVDVANTAYQNSQVEAEVRLVHAMQVTYTDANTNDLALEQLSGYRSGSGSVPPNSAFNALRAARETYGADLVTLVRKFQDPEQDGCGIAWLLGGGKQGIGAGQGWDELGYSVVSDGTDQGTDGRTYYCRDETTAHELAHNMGSAHDRASSMGDDGVLDDPDDYGAYAFSFGYKASATTGNFYTIMAYGDSGQISYRVFSNPRVTYCGGRACGTATWEDNARSLSQTIPVVATFRATAVPLSGAEPRSDFDGDGKSDILWRNTGSGANSIWKAAKSTALQTLATVADQSWSVFGTGDFDGDGKSDILWRNTRTGANSIWRSGNVNTALVLISVGNAWKVVGTDDFDGDGKADILWRNTSTGANSIWKSGSSANVQAVTTVSSQAWIVAGVGDFDGDSTADILWRNTSTGANSIWRSGSLSTVQAVLTVADQGWKVARVGDYDGDGRDDVLWRHSNTGANSIWKAANAATIQALTTVASQYWRVAG